MPFAAKLAAPAEMGAESAAMALTLCDFQTTIWLSEDLRTPPTDQFLRFHTGAALSADQASADFAFINASGGLPDLMRFALGTHEYPDRSTTLIIKTAALSDAGVSLKGPGIQTMQGFGAAPLAADFWSQLKATRADFPLGLDVIFASPGQIAAIPRSTEIS